LKTVENFSQKKEEKKKHATNKDDKSLMDHPHKAQVVNTARCSHR
jgi:hypothetical protein